MIYWRIALYTLKKYSIYPTEIIAVFLDAIISFTILIFFWANYNSSNPAKDSLMSIIWYFLLANALSYITFARGYKFGRSVQKVIKSGELSTFMMRPIKLIPHLFSGLFVGKYGYHIFLGIAYLILSFVLITPVSIANVFIFLVMTVFAAAISIGLNIIMATFQFYTTEAGSIKNVFDHVTKILSGAFIPIYFFPIEWRRVVELTPFAQMVYGPIQALRSEINETTAIYLGLALFWAIFINIIAVLIWNKSIKSYEATGI